VAVFVREVTSCWRRAISSVGAATRTLMSL
jgi:hypothetical protein